MTLDPGGARSVTIDHVIPISRGGGKRAYNQVGACRYCNRLKSDLIPEDYAALYIAIYLQVLWRWSGARSRR
jgi:5-methylcytosine-specific restriction endonuclease McrA